MQEKIKNRTIYLCSPKKLPNTQFLPMITFKRILDFLDLSSFDTLLFTSKQAVYFLDEINCQWREKKILAVGKQTAKVCKELGAKDIYNPTEFYAVNLAYDIVNRFKDAKILYVRPKVVSFDSKAYLASAGIDIKEALLYETTCIHYKKRDLAENAVIIFTSPSTIECFFKSFKWKDSYKAVVIGKSTLTKLPSYINASVAKEPTIISCIETAQNL